MPRGGKRVGTQGKAYVNRTDLAQNYGPGGNPATGGMAAPADQTPLLGPAIGADQVPNIGDPTAYPDQPVTAGLSMGAGPGPEAIGPLPPDPIDPVRAAVEALLVMYPNPDLIRVLNRLNFEGR
jgi:hypothetical protein